MSKTNDSVLMHSTSPLSDRLLSSATVGGGGGGTGEGGRVSESGSTSLPSGLNYSGSHFLHSNMSPNACPTHMNLPSPPEYRISPASALAAQATGFSSTLLFPAYYSPLGGSALSSLPCQTSISCPAIMHERGDHFHRNSTLYNFLASNSGAINLSKRLN